ncbi:MAG: hypothetical protein U0736_03285 [Gemmataceae bacterium]
MARPYLGPITTEADWLASGSPEQMIRFLDVRGSLRRWQLFACHCCWRIVPLLIDERSLRAVAMAERQAEGTASADEIALALQDAQAAEVEVWATARRQSLGTAATAARRCLTTPRRVYHSAAAATASGADRELIEQTDLLRDLFGNPFRPVVFDASWRTPTVRAMAEHFYAADGFTEMPILGDALEDAGCADVTVLDHCRQPGRHVRGCWVVDGLLEKP